MDVDPKGGIMKIDPKEVPSVHVLLNIVKIFFETPQSDPKSKEIFPDAKWATAGAIAMLSRPGPDGEACKGSIIQIYADKYPFKKAV
jgi:hypothetical protein